MTFAMLLIVVDDDVDVQNLSYTAWKVLNNVDWRRDVVISEGPLMRLTMPQTGQDTGQRWA